MRIRSSAATCLVLLVLLGGCSSERGTSSEPATSPDDGAAQTAEPGSPASVPVSTQCADAFEAMKKGWDELYALPEYEDADANALELLPLQDCSTAAEYISAGRANPEALGLTTEAAVADPATLAVRCDPSFPEGRATPVCQDAIATGVVP